MKKSWTLRVVSSLGVIALAGAMALAQDAAPTSGPRSDGQIEMDVVHALDASQALKNDLITAATVQSEVTLSGTV
jgi:osmotically-inducible protein OsmY